jgi:hypothetical protein
MRDTNGHMKNFDFFESCFEKIKIALSFSRVTPVVLVPIQTMMCLSVWNVLIVLYASIPFALSQQCTMDLAALRSPCQTTRNNCVNDVSDRFANYVGENAHLQNSVGPFVSAIKVCGDAYVSCMRSLQTTPECTPRLRESVELMVQQTYNGIVGVSGAGSGPCCSSHTDGSPFFTAFAGGFDFDSSSCCANPMGGEYRCCRGALLLPPEPIVWPNADGTCSVTAQAKCGASISRCLEAAYDPHFPGSIDSQCSYCFAQVCQCAVRFNCTDFAEQALNFYTVDASNTRSGYRLCPRPMSSICGVPSTTSSIVAPTMRPTSSCSASPPLDCSYYSTCLQPLTGPQCTVVTSIMAAKCVEYVQLESSLALTGQQWSAYVRPCLVKKIIAALNANVLDKCARATDVFFNEHMDCYLNGPVSFCDLTIGDQAAIVGVASTIIFTSHAVDASKSGAELLARCVGRATQNAASKIYFRLQMKLRSLIRKRANDDVSAALLSASTALRAVVEEQSNVTLAVVTIETNRTSALAIVMAQVPTSLSISVAANLSVAMSGWLVRNNQTVDASFEPLIAEPTQTQTSSTSISTSSSSLSSSASVSIASNTTVSKSLAQTTSAEPPLTSTAHSSVLLNLAHIFILFALSTL